MKKIKKIIHSKKGESLIESLISILIFSLLIVTVTLTIATALRITAQATEHATNAQDRVNEIIAGNYNGESDRVFFTFTYEAIDDDIVVSHIVEITEETGKLAFRPS